jgi:LPS-assembly protein
MSRRHGSLLQAAIVAMLLAYAAQTQAQTQSRQSPPGGGVAAATGSNAPVLVTADRLNYDQTLGVVRAEGKVELTQGSRTLLADMVTYSERDDKATASGNVSLLEENGTVIFAEYMELTDGMRNGFIRDISFLLTDMSRGAGVQAERKDGNRTIMKKAVYTTCSLCESDPTRAPLWQIKGSEVEHNEAEQEVKYRNAVFELFGVPVLYSPYFSHPDPTVNRRSGFLPPRYFNSPFFQQAVQTPYFYVIDEYSDLTLMPQYSTRQGPFLGADYRQRFATGEIQLDGSVANEQTTNDTRGHIRANAAFRASEDVTYGASILRSSDDTYLGRYSIQDRPSTNTLVSRVYGEAINNRHFASVNAFAFQNTLERVRNNTVPVAVPVMDYSAIFEPGDYGGRWALDANMVSLMREQGSDMRRMTSTVSWSQPYYAPSGEVFTATAMMRADGYWADNVGQSIVPGSTDGGTLSGRVLPAVALDWRYPMVRDVGRMRQLVEPIVMGVISPYGGNRSDIPNEDSVSFEFDETNLFSLSRFPGYDRWDGGPRLNYGMRMAAYSDSSGYVEFLAGQSLRAKADDTFTEASGLRDQFSDYVGRLTVSPGRYIQIVDRVRLAQNSNLDVRRHELGATLGSNINNISLSYADLVNTDYLRQTDRQEAVAATVRMQLTKYWATEIRHSRDLADNGSLLNFFGLRYTDECFDIILFAERSFTVNRDIQPDTLIGVRFKIASFN